MNLIIKNKLKLFFNNFKNINHKKILLKNIKIFLQRKSVANPLQFATETKACNDFGKGYVLTVHALQRTYPLQGIKSLAK